MAVPWSPCTKRRRVLPWHRAEHTSVTACKPQQCCWDSVLLSPACAGTCAEFVTLVNSCSCDSKMHQVGRAAAAGMFERVWRVSIVGITVYQEKTNCKIYIFFFWEAAKWAVLTHFQDFFATSPSAEGERAAAAEPLTIYTVLLSLPYSLSIFPLGRGRHRRFSSLVLPQNWIRYLIN